MRKILITAAAIAASSFSGLALAQAVGIASGATTSVDIELSGSLEKRCEIATIGAALTGLDLEILTAQGTGQLSVRCNYSGSPEVTLASLTPTGVDADVWPKLASMGWLDPDLTFLDQAVLHEEAGYRLLPAPYWTTYPESIRLAGGVPVELPTHEATGFRVTIDQLEAALTPATVEAVRALVKSGQADVGLVIRADPAAPGRPFLIISDPGRAVAAVSAPAMPGSASANCSATFFCARISRSRCAAPARRAWSHGNFSRPG